MRSSELKSFCNRWIEKADNYTNDSIEDVFDRFFSLYVVYNALYFEITLELKSIGKEKGTGDRVSATKNVPVYIGNEKLYKKLQELTPQIETIVQLIEQGTFYISTKKDNITPDKIKDKKYVDYIKFNKNTTSKTSIENFNIGLLSLIYGTRCNMFHGKKGFDLIQIQLISPMNDILVMIIKELLLKDHTIEANI